MTNKANEAIAATKTHQAGLEVVAKDVQSVKTEVAGLTGFRESTTMWRADVDHTLGGVGTLIEKGVRAEFGTTMNDLVGRVAKVEGSVMS